MFHERSKNRRQIQASRIVGRRRESRQSGRLPACRRPLAMVIAGRLGRPYDHRMHVSPVPCGTAHRHGGSRNVPALAHALSVPEAHRAALWLSSGWAVRVGI